MKVLLFATHPYSSNGYCRVAHALARGLSGKPDIQLTYWGFQNFKSHLPSHEAERRLPDDVTVYDAFANEKTPGGMGFGFEEVTDFVTLNRPDVVVIYNDMVVVSNIVAGLKRVPKQDRNFKIVVYVDLLVPAEDAHRRAER
jgi:hypothetical protein